MPILFIPGTYLRVPILFLPGTYLRAQKGPTSAPPRSFCPRVSRASKILLAAMLITSIRSDSGGVNGVVPVRGPRGSFRSSRLEGIVPFRGPGGRHVGPHCSMSFLSSAQNLTSRIRYGITWLIFEVQTRCSCDTRSKTGPTDCRTTTTRKSTSRRNCNWVITRT